MKDPELKNKINNKFYEEFFKHIQTIAKKPNEKIEVLRYLHQDQEKKGSLPGFISKLKIKDKDYQKWHQHFKELKEAGFIKEGTKDSSDKRTNIYEIVNIPFTNILLNLSPPYVYSFHSSTTKLDQPWKSEEIEKKLRECITDMKVEDIKRVVERTESLVSMLGLPAISKGLLRMILVEVMSHINDEERDDRFEKYAYIYEPVSFLKENIKRYERSTDTISAVITKKTTKKYMLSNLPFNIQKKMWQIGTKSEKGGFFYLHGARHLINPLNIAHDVRVIFVEGVKTSTGYVKRCAQHFDSVLSQIVELLMFTQPDIGGTQCIDHLNYFVAPYYKKAEKVDGLSESIIKNILQGFIEDMSRQFIARTISPIYSGLILDANPKYVDGMNVVYAGDEHTNEKYEDYKKEAESITQIILEICAEESKRARPFRSPHIFLRAKKNDLQRNKELLNSLFNVACNMESVYLVNMDATLNNYVKFPPTYFPDLSRVHYKGKRTYICSGHIQSATIYLPNFVDNSSTELDTNKQLEYIDTFLRIIEWKKEKIRKRLEDNDFYILGRNNWTIMGENTPYFSCADPPATLRFYGTYQLAKIWGKKTNDTSFISRLQSFFNKLKKREYADSFALGLTPLESGAIKRFSYEGSFKNKSALISPIFFPLKEEKNSVKEQVAIEGSLQKELDGGSALRIFITPTSSYKPNDFLNDLLICMNDNIPLINIRRAEKVIGG